MKDGLGLNADELHEVFAEWNKGELDSYLIEITTRHLRQARTTTASPSSTRSSTPPARRAPASGLRSSALDLGMPVTLIGEAVFARCLSAIKDERVAAVEDPARPAATNRPTTARQFIEDIRRALYCSKIISYAQGYMLLREAGQGVQGWNLNFGGIALMWRGGCIIRCRFLGKIKEAFDKNPKLTNLLLDAFFTKALIDYQASWRRAVVKAVEYGMPVPAFTTALAFYDGYRTGRLPANLLQAQRDYFGAHTYERVDKPRGEFFHTNWTGRGGRVASGIYNA